MPDRSVHFVGTYPADSADEAMREIVDIAGSHMKSLPDGETVSRRDGQIRRNSKGEVITRRNWAVGKVDEFRDRDDVEMVRDGSWTSYADCPRFRVKRNHTLTADTLNLGHADDAKESHPEFDKVRAEKGLPDLAFQVGIPMDYDLSFFTFGPAAGLKHRPVFRDVLAREIAQTFTSLGDDAIFQFEFPVETVMTIKAPKLLRASVAKRLAKGMAKLPAAAPVGIRTGIHGCLGNMNNEPLEGVDIEAIVAMIMATCEAWPGGRPLEYVHLPLATGEDFPTTNLAAYRALAPLAELPPDVRIVPGFVHEGQDLAQQIDVRNAIEDVLGRAVGVGLPCGMGRRSRGDAQVAARRTVAVADAP